MYCLTYNETEGNFDTKLYTWLQQLGQSNYSCFCLSAVLVLRVVTPHLMAAREERRIGTLMGRKRGIQIANLHRGGRRDSIERSQVPTFHVSSRPPLSFLSLVAKRSSTILCCKQQKAGWTPGKRLKSYKFTSFSDTWVASFPGSSPAIVTTPERSLGSKNEEYVCKLGSLLVIWEVEQFQDGGVKEGCLCDKIDRYRHCESIAMFLAVPFSHEMLGS